jgi:hypothetical protein
MKTLKEKLEYNLDEMLFTGYHFEYYTTNVESDPETGDFIINGKKHSELSHETDETYGILQDQFAESRKEFMKTLDKYIDERVKEAVAKIK